MKSFMVDGMLGFQPYFFIRRNYDCSVVSSTRRLHFTPQENFLILILLEAAWTP